MVHYKEIQKIILELVDDNGYICRKAFQNRIENLELSTLDKSRSIKNNKLNFKVNTRNVIIMNITDYQRDAKRRGFVTSYIKFIKQCQKRFNLYNVDVQNIKLEISNTSKYSIWGLDPKHAFDNLEQFSESNFVGSLTELSGILKVSRPTLGKWEKAGMIIRKRPNARLLLREEKNLTHVYPFTYDSITCYDLEVIKQQLKELR
jgi:hypothetical protein